MRLTGNDELLKPNAGCKVAVIGSRNCSYKDRRRAEEYGRRLAKSGFILVSGLANGIDTHAHLGAMQGEHKQIAVLPTLDTIYPENNTILAQEILDMDGLLVAPSTTVTNWKELYLIRDRLLVDISEYVVPLGDVLKGGTGYTYNYAREEKKLLNHNFIEALNI